MYFYYAHILTQNYLITESIVVIHETVEFFFCLSSNLIEKFSSKIRKIN